MLLRAHTAPSHSFSEALVYQAPISAKYQRFRKKIAILIIVKSNDRDKIEDDILSNNF